MGLLKAEHRLRHPLPRTVVLVRALPGLGDFLCWVPALRALHRALPQARLTWIGLPETADLMQRYCYIQNWLQFPGYPGIPEAPVSPQQTISFLAQMQQVSFDLALQMHGSGLMINSFTTLLGAKQTAGFFPVGQPCPDPQRFLAYPEREPEIWRHLRLLEFLGIPLQGDKLEFPLWQTDWHECKAIVSAYELQPRNYICIHPGASMQTKCWSAQGFATVADALAAQGFQIVLTGTNAEVGLTQSVARTMQFPSIDLAGQTSLGALAVLLKQARLLICNDTGISHLAAALQVKSVVLFSNSDPHRWAPLDQKRHRVIQLAASNDTMSRTGRCSVEATLAEARDLLHQEMAYAS
ncbi:glycosyltransferase family 9 protein [Leptolyngbya sp. NK1-12]|uniref:Glycosyltransferase family 9 protein n=1 Tax=Leptolyngbya sp. NK1-12 TaxID=2547451 RepID=A0AA96WQG0_9CYAN|nr:glycosyltransferase family 9 protein [Leptolyngbya sp. NK1-12]WNZ27366.1 glycosyltransferase family 9 protein [Leptolyngbya sp. NK1-12]